MAGVDSPGTSGESGADPVREVITVGVLSDTHGHLYQGVKALLTGVGYIIHAGDVGSPQVLSELRAIAPVTAVRGNCDYEAWALALPMRAELELGGVRILVGHVAARLREWTDASGRLPGGSAFSVVISGHSHVAALEERAGTLFLNPGSAGPRRFDHPRTVARLTIRSTALDDSWADVGVEAEILAVEGRQ
jgi:uncharacterized protein